MAKDYTKEEQIKALEALSKSKGREILSNSLKITRSNKALAIVQRVGQSQPEFSMDDMYKREISILNAIMKFVPDKIAALQTEVEHDVTKEDDLDIGDTDDLFKTLG